ncbi:hypothetical protein Bca4012_083949 [Brassica carinata]
MRGFIVRVVLAACVLASSSVRTCGWKQPGEEARVSAGTRVGTDGCARSGVLISSSISSYAGEARSGASLVASSPSVSCPSRAGESPRVCAPTCRLCSHPVRVLVLGWYGPRTELIQHDLMVWLGYGHPGGLTCFHSIDHNFSNMTPNVLKSIPLES